MEMVKTINELYDSFIEYRKVCNLKHNDGILKTFIAHANMSSSAPYLSHDIVAEWFTKRPSENNNSYNVRITHVNAFLKYINRFHNCDFKLGQLLDPVPISEPIIPTSEELKLFFDAVDEVEKQAIRIKSKLAIQMHQLKVIQAPVIFRLLKSSGMRPIEARYLGVSDVDLNNGIIHIREGKGYRQRNIVLHPNMLKLLRQYDVYVSEFISEREAFFCDISGGFRSKHWPSEWFNEFWESKNEPNRQVVVYCLRHLFVIDMINSWDSSDNLDLKFERLTRVLGHSSAATTIKYYYHLTEHNSIIINEEMNDYFNRVVPNID